MFRCLNFLLLSQSVVGLYSVHYIASEEQPQFTGKQSFFAKAPDAIHVADMYARMSGLPPLLREGFLF